jgi:hypothetical protein
MVVGSLTAKGGKAVRKILVLSVVLFVMVFLTGASNPAGQAVQRPIEDFVDRQGTFCVTNTGVWPFEGYYHSEPCTHEILFVPPVANFLGWSDPAKGRLMSVDYAGLADYYANGAFGTETTGTVTERPLKDGRAEIHVLLRTENALMWVVDDGPPLTWNFNGPLLFGHRAPEVLAGGVEPALGTSFLQVRFINTAPGAPLPDLIQLFYAWEEGQEPLFLATNARAEGPLRELFGVPEGTPGRAGVVQTGLFIPPAQGPGWDAFPAERIELQVVGH